MEAFKLEKRTVKVIMDATHLHLALNHAPLFGTLFALGLLIYGLWRKSEELKKTAMGAVVVLTLLTFPVYFSGDSAAEKPALSRDPPNLSWSGMMKRQPWRSLLSLSLVCSPWPD